VRKGRTPSDRNVLSRVINDAAVQRVEQRLGIRGERGWHFCSHSLPFPLVHSHSHSRLLQQCPGWTCYIIHHITKRVQNAAASLVLNLDQWTHHDCAATGTLATSMLNNNQKIGNLSKFNLILLCLQLQSSIEFQLRQHKRHWPLQPWADQAWE